MPFSFIHIVNRKTNTNNFVYRAYALVSLKNNVDLHSFVCVRLYTRPHRPLKEEVSQEALADIAGTAPDSEHRCAALAGHDCRGAPTCPSASGAPSPFSSSAGRRAGAQGRICCRQRGRLCGPPRRHRERQCGSAWIPQVTQPVEPSDTTRLAKLQLFGDRCQSDSTCVARPVDSGCFIQRKRISQFGLL